MNPDIAPKLSTPENECTETGMLTADDQPWLSRLACREVTDDEINKLNAVVEIGSINLITAHDESETEVLGARDLFFSKVLGWEDEDHPLHNSFESFVTTHIRSMPLSTVIKTQQVLNRHDFDVAKIVNMHPFVLGYSPDSITAKIEYFTDLGINAYKVIDKTPNALGLSQDNIQGKLDNFTELGLDAIKMVNAQPSVLRNNTRTVKAKLNRLTELGLDAVRVANTLPGVLSFNPDSVKTKMDNLTELGLDAARVVNAKPVVLSLNPTGVKLRLQLLDNYLTANPSLKNHQTFITQSLIRSLESTLIGVSKLDMKSIAPKSLEQQTRKLMGDLGIQPTTTSRKEYLRQHQDELHRSVGCLAVKVSRYAKAEGTVPSYLEGEVIPTIVRRP